MFIYLYLHEIYLRSDEYIKRGGSCVRGGLRITQGDANHPPSIWIQCNLEKNHLLWAYQRIHQQEKGSCVHGGLRITLGDANHPPHWWIVVQKKEITYQTLCGQKVSRRREDHAIHGLLRIAQRDASHPPPQGKEEGEEPTMYTHQTKQVQRTRNAYTLTTCLIE